MSDFGTRLTICGMLVMDEGVRDVMLDLIVRRSSENFVIGLNALLLPFCLSGGICGLGKMSREARDLAMAPFQGQGS